MRIGTDYYPEHWGKERFKVDADLMMDAGVNSGTAEWSMWLE